jgi:hypothetical protein
MKIQKSSQISPFGGLNFVFEAFNKVGLDKFINTYFPKLPIQSKYNWKDILYSFWSVFFCGGDCVEDISINLKSGLSNNPFIKLPSPDRVLNRLKQLSTPDLLKTIPGRIKTHHFSINLPLNNINQQLFKRLKTHNNVGHVLDYDNTLLFSNKADAAKTYKKRYGYNPGVGIIDKNIVYVENRNGNSNAEAMQKETLERMFGLLRSNNIKIRAFRADGASYSLSVINEIQKNVDLLYVRCSMSEALNEAIIKIDKWDELIIDNRKVYRGSTLFTPFKGQAKRKKKDHLLKQYRLIVTKEPRDDGQINMFTGEAFNYRGILTNDFESTNDEVVIFYNQRGAVEREFDVLKNDFGWNNMPFSKLEQNTVFLIITAMCRNLYEYIINEFSKLFKHLKPYYRIKKFIFRFICIPGKWVKTARTYKLRIYGHIAFKT